MIITLWLGRLILALLGGLSIWSVSIMIDRARHFKALRAEDGAALRTSLEKGTLSAPSSSSGFLSGALKVGLASAPQGRERVERAIRSYVTHERVQMEKGLTVLATLGSNAPFIGLLGTVLGIIQAFGELGRQGSGSQTVMTGISEALIATAVGLFVAIPAVVAFNTFNRSIRVLLSECDSLKDLFLSSLQKD